MRLRRHEIWIARARLSFSYSLGLARRHKRKRHGKLIGRRRAREMCDLIKKPPPSRTQGSEWCGRDDTTWPPRRNKFSFYDEKAIKRGARRSMRPCFATLEFQRSARNTNSRGTKWYFVARGEDVKTRVHRCCEAIKCRNQVEQRIFFPPEL